jgi:hypothetical protein
MSNIRQVLDILNHLSATNVKARNWKNGYAYIMNPRIEMMQAALYVSKSEDSFMDQELEVFMIQVSYENNWYQAGDFEKLEEEKIFLYNTAQDFFGLITSYFWGNKNLIMNLGDYINSAIQEAISYFNTNKSFFGGLKDEKLSEFTDRVSKCYTLQNILKPISAALLIHNFLLANYKGSYEEKYKQLEVDLKKKGYTLKEEDKILIFIRDNASTVQHTIDELEEFIIR